jgi:hypothetical protein
MLKDGELQCLLDEKSGCVHVGVVYSLPEMYNMNEEISASPLSIWRYVIAYHRSEKASIAYWPTLKSDFILCLSVSPFV